MKKNLEDMKEFLIACVFTVAIITLTIIVFTVSLKVIKEEQEQETYEEGVYTLETYRDKDYDITYLILKDRLGDVIRADIMVEGEE